MILFDRNLYLQLNLLLELTLHNAYFLLMFLGVFVTNFLLKKWLAVSTEFFSIFVPVKVCNFIKKTKMLSIK